MTTALATTAPASSSSRTQVRPLSGYDASCPPFFTTSLSPCPASGCRSLRDHRLAGLPHRYRAPAAGPLRFRPASASVEVACHRASTTRPVRRRFELCHASVDTTPSGRCARQLAVYQLGAPSDTGRLFTHEQAGRIGSAAVAYRSSRRSIAMTIRALLSAPLAEGTTCARDRLGSPFDRMRTHPAVLSPHSNRLLRQPEP